MKLPQSASRSDGMNSPLAEPPVDFTETTTCAKFWHERKWHWILEAIVFVILGLACAWPIIAAGGAMFELLHRLAL
jgi:hypothetical protein